MSNRNLDVVLAAVREFFNGYDTGSSFVKMPIWLAGSTVTIFHAPFVIAFAGAFGLLYLLRSLYEYYERKKEEKAKEAQKDKLNQMLASLEADLTEKLAAEAAHEEEVTNRRTALCQQNKNDNDIEAEINQLIKEKAAEKFAIFKECDNKALLKCLLQKYFAVLQANDDRIKVTQPRKLTNTERVTYGKRPTSCKKILSLIQAVSGINPHYTDFHTNLDNYFNHDMQLSNQAKRYLPPGRLERQQPRGIAAYLYNKWWAIRAFAKRQKTLRHLGRVLHDFLTDFSTGGGLLEASLLMFGVIVSGIPVTAPFIGLILVAGFAYGLISLVTQRINNDKIKRRTRTLDKEIKQLTVRAQLFKQLTKLNKPNYSKNLKEESCESFDDVNEVVIDDSLHAELVKKYNIRIPTKVYIRMALGLLGQIINGVSFAVLTGICLAWMATVMFPALPLLVPSLIIGFAMSINYAYQNINREMNAIKNELAVIEEVQVLKIMLLAKYQKKAIDVAKDLPKDSKVLLKELLQEYVKFINEKNPTPNHKNKYRKQEKIFNLIESIAGIKREEKNGKMLLVGSDQFYHELAHYLKGTEKANEAVANFKQLFINTYPADITKDVGIKPELADKHKAGNSKIKQFLRRHSVPFLTAVSIGFLIPLFLGAQFWVVIPVAVIVIGAYLLTVYAKESSQNNLTALNEEQHKIALIDRKAKLSMKNPLALASQISLNPTTSDAVEATLSCRSSKDQAAPMKFWQSQNNEALMNGDKTNFSLNPNQFGRQIQSKSCNIF
jgi:hypothetical protein